MSTLLRLLLLEPARTSRRLVVICAAGITATLLFAQENGNPVKGNPSATSLHGSAVLWSTANPDGTISTGDAIAAAPHLASDSFPGTFDADGHFTFEGTLCFDFSSDLGILDPPTVPGVAEPADGCRMTTVAVRGSSSSSLLDISPGDPGTTLELDLNWTDQVPTSDAKTDDVPYALSFHGDANLDGRVESSKVMGWCEWPVGSAQQQRGVPAVDSQGCLAWIVAPCGGSVVRGSGSATEFPVQCAAEQTAWVPSPDDPNLLVEAPVGQVVARARGSTGPPATTAVARYRMPHQIAITRQPDAPVVGSFNPNSGPPGTWVTIAGSGFTGATAVWFNTAATETFVVDSDAQVRASVPAGADSGPISVMALEGTGVSAVSFTVSVPAAPPVEVTPAEPASSSQGIWISRDEIMNLPMSGPAWDALVGDAQRDPGFPNLSDQDQQNNVLVLARALVCIRTADEALCETARQAVMAAIDTENGGRTLALGRELLAYVITADLVGLDPERDAVFRSWLVGVLAEELDGRTLISTHEDRPNNWGTHAGASRAAAVIYLGDAGQLHRVASVFKGYLGDRTSYAGFRYGELSWQVDPTLPVGINPVGSLIEGHDVDGVAPDDQRRAGTFSWPPPKSIYAWEALQGAVAQAVVLHRAGYDVWNWEDQALRRAVAWLHAEGDYPAEGDDTWLPHLVNHYYGTQFPAPVPSRPGKNVGYTDWTHAGAE
jgi:hypothetical protein